MKKFKLFLLLILSFSIKSNAQTVPNLDFESWTPVGSGLTAFNRLDYWQTTDSFSVNLITGPQHSATMETSSVFHGSAALRLTPFLYLGSVAIPGAASNGTINTTTLQIIGGSSDTVRHQTLSGWYQYTPAGGDVSSISIALFKSNGVTRDTVAKGVLPISATASTYTHFQIDLNYLSLVFPDSALITIYSGPPTIGGPHMGTVLLVDSLTFSGTVPTGVNEISQVVNSIHIYPVPAINDLTVNIDLKKDIHTSFEIIDLTGKRILVHEMNSREEKVDISQLSNGNYFYNLLDEKSNKLSSGKFSVNR